MTTATTTAAEPRWFFANLARVLVSNYELGIVEATGPQGDMPPLHVHHLEDETFVVLEGELTVHTPEGSVSLSAGEALVAPKGVPHVYRVESATARWLAVTTPGDFAKFVLAASEPAEYDGLPPAGREVDPGPVFAIADAHGIDILGPPGAMP
jgi:quercetin dioxygenase-like cupin family protein